MSHNDPDDSSSYASHRIYLCVELIKCSSFQLGPKVNFKKRKLKTDNFVGLPSLPVQVLDELTDKHHSIKERLRDFKVVEICNLEYQRSRGSSIEPHFDDFYFWGDRIVTLNLLSSTKLILTKNIQSCGDRSIAANGGANDNSLKKTPMNCLTNRPPIDDQANNRSTNYLNENSQTDDQDDGQLMNDVEIIINLNRRSLLILFDEARYKWLHEIRRDHIQERRLAITYRELSREFLPGGALFDDQIDKLLALASNRI